MIWLLVGTLIPSFVVSWLVARVLIGRAAAWGFVDEPGERKVHTRPTPLGGGLAIWAGVVIPFAIGQGCLFVATSHYPSATAPIVSAEPSPPPHAIRYGEMFGLSGTPRLPDFLAQHVAGLRSQSGKLWLLLAAATGLMLLGLADDRVGLDWRLRLAVQTSIAAAVVFGLDWRATLFINWPLLTGLITVAWIVTLTNSFNMLDNMDGLAAGVAAIAAAILAAVMLVTRELGSGQPQLFVAGLLLVLVGSLAGFLMHNRPPARIFMGDAGSYFVGFYIAVAAVLATFSGGSLPRHATLAPLCVLAIPLYDLVSVVWIRLRSGRSPFVGDKSHFSHRLVEIGFTPGQAVAIIYLATAVCGLGAFLLHQVSPRGAVLIVLQVVCTLALVGLLEARARRSARNRLR